MQNVIALILANLPTLIEAGKAGFDFVQSVRATAQQSGEWTEAQEAEFQAKLAEQAFLPAWQCDPPQIPAPEPALVDQTVTGLAATVASQAETPAPAPEVASADTVKCPVCGCKLISDHPGNCNCVIS